MSLEEGDIATEAFDCINFIFISIIIIIIITNKGGLPLLKR